MRIRKGRIFKNRKPYIVVVLEGVDGISAIESVNGALLSTNDAGTFFSGSSLDLLQRHADGQSAEGQAAQKQDGNKFSVHGLMIKNNKTSNGAICGFFLPNIFMRRKVERKILLIN